MASRLTVDVDWRSADAPRSSMGRVTLHSRGVPIRAVLGGICTSTSTEKSKYQTRAATQDHSNSMTLTRSRISTETSRLDWWNGYNHRQTKSFSCKESIVGQT